MQAWEVRHYRAKHLSLQLLSRALHSLAVLVLHLQRLSGDVLLDAGAQSQHMDEAGSQAWEGPVEEQPPSILRQTEAALGLWEQLHVTASTPSTVLPPQNARATSAAAFSASTDQSAA